MSKIEQGKIRLSLKNPLSSETIFIEDLKKYLKDENNILIYLDDDPIPYCMKRTYFINLLAEDFDYECNNKHEVNTSIKYYNLSKLFLNVEGQPKIIIKMSDIKNILSESNNTRFKLISVKNKLTNKPIKKLTYTNIDLQRINYIEGENYANDTGIPKKWEALTGYCNGDYSYINRYLIRLTDIPSRLSLNELSKVLLNKIISILGLSKETTEKIIKPRIDNIVIQSEIDDIDHIFYKYAKKSKEPIVVYRGMSFFYAYLKNPGDKMVLENYTSCFDDEGGLSGQVKVWCKITIEPGVPYFQTYLDKEFRKFLNHPEEMEVILPRNLVATYHGEDEDDNKLITVSPLYPNQFINEQICNEMTLYKIQKSKDDNFEWKNIRGNLKNIDGGSRKNIKKKQRISLRIKKK